MTPVARNTMTILLADDDPDDRLLVVDALAARRVLTDLHTVTDGEELVVMTTSNRMRTSTEVTTSAPARSSTGQSRSKRWWP
jgi:hypothetical protein